VDDDPGTRETFDWALRSCGVRVRTSASGADAIELAQTHTFDLLLLDLELRDMRGTDVIRVVRTPTVCVPFVLISAFLTTEVTVEAMRLGALHVLDKPVSIDDLPPLVVAALAGQRAPKTRPRATVLANLTRLADTKHARSTAERWAFNVIKGCLAEADPRTLKE
jgi:two-component system response regulator AtoC